MCSTPLNTLNPRNYTALKKKKKIKKKRKKHMHLFTPFNKQTSYTCV